MHATTVISGGPSASSVPSGYQHCLDLLARTSSGEATCPDPRVDGRLRRGCRGPRGPRQCPSWCTGCAENEQQHAGEYEGPGGPDDSWDAITRPVQDHHGGPALVELDVVDEDGNEATVRMTPDQAAELAAAIDNAAGCALRLA